MAGYSVWKVEFLIPTWASLTWALLAYVILPSYNHYTILQSGALSWVVLRGWRRSGSRRESESDACGRGFVLSRAPCPRSDDVDHLLQLLLIESVM
ncbi:hypothetical protein M405DRAFT_823581 [Rhizopogon salebrosus TDB-379]|nr:hypothetical protein M405DRAFT_823581 [Rhizopogon salebrosus TDB-379]